MNAALFLELLNGGAVTPEAIWLVLLTIYLAKEAKRRGLRRFDSLHLPPSMNLILAIYVCDAGVTIRSVTVWFWRRFGGGHSDFGPIESGLLTIGGALIVWGFLCKIRAITAPDHGDGPWITAMLASAIAIVALVVLR